MPFNSNKHIRDLQESLSASDIISNLFDEAQLREICAAIIRQFTIDMANDRLMGQYISDVDRGIAMEVNPTLSSLHISGPIPNDVYEYTMSAIQDAIQEFGNDDDLSSTTDPEILGQRVGNAICSSVSEAYDNGEFGNTGGDDDNVQDDQTGGQPGQSGSSASNQDQAKVKKNRLKTIADGILSKYTENGTADGKQQYEEAKRIIFELIDSDGSGPSSMDEPIRRQLANGLANGKPEQQVNAVLTVLLKFTGLKSYVTEDRYGKEDTDPIHTTYLRRVADDTTIAGGTIMPASFTVDKSKIMWDQAVIEEFGDSIPVLNEDSEEIQILLSKDATFIERTMAITRIRTLLRGAKINQAKLYNAIKNLAVEKPAPVSLSPLIINEDLDKFMTTISGDDTFDAWALSTKVKGRALKVTNLNIMFLSSFYKVLSPASGAGVYVNKAKEFSQKIGLSTYSGSSQSECIKSFKQELETEGHPKFFILVPATKTFTKSSIDSTASSILSLFNASIHLVRGTLGSHKVILVLNHEKSNALFGIRT